MTKFKTITEKQLLDYAYYNILDKWVKETEKIERNPESEMVIAKHRERKYKEQLDELRTRIIEFEKAE